MIWVGGSQISPAPPQLLPTPGGGQCLMLSPAMRLRTAPYSFRIGMWNISVYKEQNPIHPQPLKNRGPLQEKHA